MLFYNFFCNYSLSGWYICLLHYIGFFCLQTFATTLLENIDSLLTGGTLDSYQQAMIASLFWDGMCEMDVSKYRTYAKGNLSSLLNGVLPST